MNEAEVPEPPKEPLGRLLAAEAFGTFSLVFAGCGAIVVDQVTGGTITHVGVGLTFGLVVMAMIYAVGDISGAHLNPAVTLGFLVAGRVPARRCAPYITAQLGGALLAAGLLRILFPENELLGATLPSGSLFQSFLLEVVLTMILMLVILRVSAGSYERGLMAGVAVGALITLEAMFGGPISGASMNPARSLGPALMSGHLEHIWIYLVAPVVGAALAVPLCCLMGTPGCCGAESTYQG